MTKDTGGLRRFGASKWLFLLLGVALIVGIGISIPKMKRMMQERAQHVPSEKERYAQVIQQDKDNLIKKDASEYELYAALIRLAQQKDPAARQEALQKSTSPSKLIREACANALGYYDDEESLTYLQKFLGDPEVSVRIQALQGVGHVQGTAREKILGEFLKKKGLGAAESAAAYTSMIQVSKTAESKNQALQDLIVYVQQIQDPREKVSATMMALSSAPRDPRVLELLKGFLIANQGSILPLAIRHLSAVRDPWLKKNLSNFTKNADSQVRLAVIQSLHLLCPADRWSILEESLKTEKDPLVMSAAVSEPRYMPGKEAIALLQRMIANNGNFKENDRVSVTALLAELQKNPGQNPDPCFVQEAIRKANEKNGMGASAQVSVETQVKQKEKQKEKQKVHKKTK